MSSYAPYHSAVEAAEENFVEECVLVAMLTLVVYEYAVTLDREVDVVWRRRPTAPSAMLLVSRWLMLLGPIAGNIPITSVARFEGIWRLTVITYALSLTVVAAFSALRVYAILLRGRLRYAVPALVGALGLVPVATNTYKWARTTLVPVPPGGYTVIALSEALETRLLYTATTSAIALEALVLGTTWVKSYEHFREMRRLRMASSVTTILLRDGTLYFVIMLVINLCQLLTYNTTAVGGSYSNIFMLYLPPLLVQRFMLNLRQLTRAPGEASASSCAGAPELRPLCFRAPPPSFLGNIGEPLEHGPAEGPEDDDDYGECYALGRGLPA